MAGGIDWFRWHHGSVTDPKFQLTARKSGASLSDVLAVWAYLLERASASGDRGSFGEIDAEALDCLFNFPDSETRTADIIAAMRDRGLLDGDRIEAWDRRQPKRERESDDTAAERKRQQRAREAEESTVTPSHATSRQETPREEKRREEEIKPKSKTEATQRASRLPADWLASESEIEFCKTERPDLDPEAMQAKFRDYWIGVPGAKGAKLDWPATWRNFIRSERAPAKQAAGAWWATDATILAKGAELGLRPGLGESMQTFKGRIQIALDNAGKLPAARASPPAPVAVAEPKRVEIPPELKAKRSEELKAAMRAKTP